MKIILRNTSAILKETQRTESKLTDEATRLIETLKISIDNGNSLYESVHEYVMDEISRKKATRKLEEESSIQISQTVSFLSELSDQSTTILKNLSSISETNLQGENR